MTTLIEFDTFWLLNLKGPKSIHLNGPALINISHISSIAHNTFLGDIQITMSNGTYIILNDRVDYKKLISFLSSITIDYNKLGMSIIKYSQS